MRCCVSYCVNNSEILPDSANVRFHRLPVEKLRRAAWIQALGIEDKYLHTVKGPSVCSLHFRTEDFHTTKSGLWVVKRCAVPKTEQNSYFKDIKVCIICLDTDRRLFSLKYYNLERPYETMTGLSLSEFTAVRSPRVCWECGQRLLNCDAFRDRSVRAHHVLLKLSQEDELLKIQTIKKVNRKKHKLKSHLMKEIFKTNHSDYQLIHDEKSKNVKTESANKHLKVKIENIVYGSDAKTEVENEEKLTIAVEPKAEVVNTDLASDEEFLHDDMDNDGFLAGDIDKDIKNDGDNLKKGTKTINFKNVKLLNTGVKVDVEFSNPHTIDFDMDCASENEHNVNNNDSNVSLPNKSLDIDMDCHEENDYNVNSPHENDEIEMDIIDKNYSDVELVESTVKSEIMKQKLRKEEEENRKKRSAKTKVKLNKKATLSVNKCKINKRQSKITLNKPKVKFNESKDGTNKDGNAVKVRKRVRKRKAESQAQGYLRRKPPTGGMELFKVSVLTYEEQVADLHSRKETALYKNSTFKCAYCFKGYQFEDPFDAHMQQHTDKYGQFECAVCGIRAVSRQKLLHHLNMAHVVRYSCTVCPFYTRHRNTAKSHGRAHKGTKTKCPHCDDVEFTNLNSLMSHVRKKHPSACVCPMCGFSFSGKMGLTLHLQRKHQVDNTQASQLDGPMCVECNIRFASEAAYEQHLAVSPTHNTDDNIQPNAPPRRRFKGLPRRRTAQTVTCEQCGAKLKGFKHYSIHFESQHRDLTRTQFANPHERRCLCEQCGRVFQNSSALKSHMLIHAGKKDIQCTICDKRFYYKRQLTLHMDIHNEPKRTFDCPVCARSFTCKSNKNRHLWTHTQVSRPFKCHACPKTFVYPSERKFHINHAHANQPYPKKPKNRVRNSRPKHVKEAPYGQIDPQSIINESSYLSETSAILNE